MNNIKDSIDKSKLPKHIAIIMDGNGRWAKQQGKERVFGHQHGVKPVKECVEGCREIGVKYLTLYAFSTENWNRPAEEINELMSLLVRTIHNEINDLIKNGVKLKFIGDFSRLYKETQQTIMESIEKTAHCKDLTVVIALSYSSKWEITNAIRKIVKDVSECTLEMANLTEDTIPNYLETKDIPDPELLVRTGGEKRISNFLLWQIAYSELYFTDLMWPDFTKERLFEAIADYQNRERRFGKTSEQIQTP